jgi:ribulose-phosphate 3-epimerase
MSIICPTVTASDPVEYRHQIERIAHFAVRLHLDFMDGLFTPTKSPELTQIWWPAGVKADVHIMYRQPAKTLPVILKHKPHLVVIHAEAEGNFQEFANALHEAGIKVGVAILAKTPVEPLRRAIESIDHVLIFSGDLGRFGGRADLSLLKKVTKLREYKSSLEIGWDGGINEHNIEALIKGGIDVLNVGGFIQKADNPGAAYAKLKVLAKKHK